MDFYEIIDLEGIRGGSSIPFLLFVRGELATVIRASYVWMAILIQYKTPVIRNWRFIRIYIFMTNDNGLPLLSCQKGEHVDRWENRRNRFLGCIFNEV